MSIIKTVVAVVFATSITVGCTSKDIQTCNDSLAKETVVKIIGENGHKYSGKGLEDAFKRVISEAQLVDIKTTDSNENLGNFECSANYNIKYKDQNGSVPVTYKLSHLEDSNTTEAQVLDSDPGRSLWIQLQIAISNNLAEDSKKLVSDYVAKRGSNFPSDIATCINTEIFYNNNEHGNWTYTANNLAEWDKMCTLESEAFHKTVSEYVNNRSGNLINEKIACIIDSSISLVNAGSNLHGNREAKAHDRDANIDAWYGTCSCKLDSCP